MVSILDFPAEVQSIIVRQLSLIDAYNLLQIKSSFQRLCCVYTDDILTCESLAGFELTKVLVSVDDEPIKLLAYPVQIFAFSKAKLLERYCLSVPASIPVDNYRRIIILDGSLEDEDISTIFTDDSALVHKNTLLSLRHLKEFTISSTLITPDNIIIDHVKQLTFNQERYSTKTTTSGDARVSFSSTVIKENPMPTSPALKSTYDLKNVDLMTLHIRGLENLSLPSQTAYSESLKSLVIDSSWFNRSYWYSEGDTRRHGWMSPSDMISISITDRVLHLVTLKLDTKIPVSLLNLSFPNLVTLEMCFVGGDSIDSIVDNVTLPSLENLLLRFNSVTDFPTIIQGIYTSPKLTNLSLKLFDERFMSNGTSQEKFLNAEAPLSLTKFENIRVFEFEDYLDSSYKLATDKMAIRRLEWIEKSTIETFRVVITAVDNPEYVMNILSMPECELAQIQNLEIHVIPEIPEPSSKGIYCITPRLDGLSVKTLRIGKVNSLVVIPVVRFSFESVSLPNLEVLIMENIRTDIRLDQKNLPNLKEVRLIDVCDRLTDTATLTISKLPRTVETLQIDYHDQYPFNVIVVLPHDVISSDKIRLSGATLRELHKWRYEVLCDFMDSLRFTVSRWSFTLIFIMWVMIWLLYVFFPWFVSPQVQPGVGEQPRE